MVTVEFDFHELKGLEFFPYPPRDQQVKMCQKIYHCVTAGRDVILEASTGSGKTIVALAPLVEYIQHSSKRVLYLTRTNAQQTQVILELRKIGKVFGTGMQGRAKLCPLLKDFHDFDVPQPEELSKFCSSRKGNTPVQPCPYYNNTIPKRSGVVNWMKKNNPTVEEVIGHCRKWNLCPYEAIKASLQSAKVVTAPYVLFFNEKIRDVFLNWMGVEPRDLIVVIDEAHNLPEHARSLHTKSLSLRSVKEAMKELELIEDYVPLTHVNPLGFLEAISETLEEIAFDYLYDQYDDVQVKEDAILNKAELHSRLHSSFQLGNDQELLELLTEYLALGEIIKQVRESNNELPRSSLHRVAEFIDFWIRLNDQNYVFLIYGGKNPKLEAFCMEPEEVTKILRECHASIHMSGTLSPLEEYRDLIGLDDKSHLHTYTASYHKTNAILLYSTDVTTRYKDLEKHPEIYEKIYNHIKQVLKNSKRNTMIVFPSFRLLQKALGLDERCQRRG